METVMNLDALHALDGNDVRVSPVGVPPTSDAIIAGSLLGDLADVAKELFRAVQLCPVTAWMNADADVLYQPAQRDVPAIAEWIAGTYASGASAADIEDDLQQLRVQRRAMGMIEI